MWEPNATRGGRSEKTEDWKLNSKRGGEYTEKKGGAVERRVTGD